MIDRDRSNGVGIDEEKTIIAVHRIFAKIREKKCYVERMEITPTEIIYHYFDIENVI